MRILKKKTRGMSEDPLNTRIRQVSHKIFPLPVPSGTLYPFLAAVAALTEVHELNYRGAHALRDSKLESLKIQKLHANDWWVDHAP